MTIPDTRPSALAGTWYAGRPEELRREVDEYIEQAELPALAGEVVALIAPHAGHRYSGPVAGYAFRAVRGNSYQTVTVVSPYHRGDFHPLLTTSHQAYETPLGSIPVDRENLQQLNITLNRLNGELLAQVTQDQEHSVEIELPFLQCALQEGFKLLPLMLSTQEVDLALDLGDALAETLAGQNALLVASTDLSHFYPEKAANLLDQAMLAAIASFEIEQVIEAHRSGKGQACGIMAVLAVMTAARKLGATQAQLLNYATSGATSGDYSRVVGYGAAALVR